MPSVEEVFDDDTDLPLPVQQSQSAANYLRNTGSRGALLEEITDDDVDAMADAAGGDFDLDMDRVAEQGKGYGDSKGRPAYTPPPGGQRPSPSSSDLRPTNDRPQQQQQQQGPMGGIMGDFMKMQQAEEARMRKLEKQLGAGMIMKDQQEFKHWNTLYPLYFDAKLSINQGRRVPRSKAVWWPQSLHIAKACSSLGLQCIHEIEKTHPADWRNPGRVKVLLQKDGKFAHPIITTRTQLCDYVATQIQKMNPSLVPKPDTIKRRRTEVIQATRSQPKLTSTSQTQGKNSKSTQVLPIAKASLHRKRTRTLPPAAPHPYPPMDDRLPINSPAVALGIAVHSVKREIEQEKERKRLGPGQGSDAAGLALGNDATGTAGKPKMKKIVVRKR
ncbi:hypothetical protein QFC22_001939 [Naganishia vaughanmartiniae]|uniref:Uncharacterized protein n=1 Tax=Naganishia vaughanmartiniae TaxID=1424756 RepID=A0ACC2XFY4_9TREE|nr:hypothetical protein QFC22_001939 [Naganishia vaughanmartiniae]